MNQLKEMLEAYRNGERGLPNYDELAEVADSLHPNDALVSALRQLMKSPKPVQSGSAANYYRDQAAHDKAIQAANEALADAERAK